MLHVYPNIKYVFYKLCLTIIIYIINHQEALLPDSGSKTTNNYFYIKAALKYLVFESLKNASA